jgi:enolase
VNEILGRAVLGLDPCDQEAIDSRLDRSLGANAVLGVSCAAARAGALVRGVPLWKHLAGSREPRIPIPMVNILSGGLHAGRNFEFQDFLVMPEPGPVAVMLERIVAVHRATKRILDERGELLTGVADEGGWGPRLPTNEAALAILTEAIERAGGEMRIAIDVASTHFLREGRYELASEGRSLTSDGMIDMLAEWAERYPVVSIEDGLAEDDWSGWQRLTARLGSYVQLVGDDLFVTNPARLERGIREGAGNAVLVKMNQIGTLTDTFAVIDRARDAGFRAVISARSGETEDPFLADLAVASGAGQIKVGSITRSERLAKYNRLLEIEAFEFPTSR